MELSSQAKQITVDPVAHAILIKCCMWLRERPHVLWLESYENDQSQAKMVGYLADHMYEDIGELTSDGYDNASDLFKHIHLNGSKLMVTDDSNEEWTILVSELYTPR